MYVVAVTIHVKPEHLNTWRLAILDNAAHTRQEPNNIRFDVLQAEDDPTRFLLYEVYQSKADFLTHQKTPHYLRWRQAVDPIMAEPRVGVKHHAIFYGDAAQ